MAELHAVLQMTELEFNNKTLLQSHHEINVHMEHFKTQQFALIEKFLNQEERKKWKQERKAN